MECHGWVLITALHVAAESIEIPSNRPTSETCLDVPGRKLGSMVHKWLGDGFKYFLFSAPIYLVKIPILTNIFQMGWFNHQLDGL